MMKYTKQERYEIYNKTLDRLKKDIEKHGVGLSHGICYHISHITYIKSYDDIIDTFREFKKQKPFDIGYNNYWWPCTEVGYEQRVKVLCNCIELTKPTK